MFVCRMVCTCFVAYLLILCMFSAWTRTKMALRKTKNNARFGAARRKLEIPVLALGEALVREKTLRMALVSHGLQCGSWRRFCQEK